MSGTGSLFNVSVLGTNDGIEVGTNGTGVEGGWVSGAGVSGAALLELDGVSETSGVGTNGTGVTTGASASWILSWGSCSVSWRLS